MHVDALPAKADGASPCMMLAKGSLYAALENVLFLSYYTFYGINAVPPDALAANPDRASLGTVLTIGIPGIFLLLC